MQVTNEHTQHFAAIDRVEAVGGHTAAWNSPHAFKVMAEQSNTAKAR